MGYCWGYDPKEQYVNGHERPDIVNYCNKEFLPKMAKLEEQTSKWGSRDGPPVMHHVVV